MFIKHTLKEAEERVRRAVETLSKYETVVNAYMFGSYVDGSADKWSDIDIAVFMENCEDWDIEREVNTSIKIYKEIGDDIELHFFPADALTNAEPASFAAYVIKHGRPIKWAR